jgi:hypothetical protein
MSRDILTGLKIQLDGIEQRLEDKRGVRALLIGLHDVGK